MTIPCARGDRAAGAPHKATGSSVADGDRRAVDKMLPGVGYVVLGITYALGGPLLGIGLYLLIRGQFPAWWRDWMLWPGAKVNPAVARLTGLTAIGLGLSLVGIGLSTLVPEFVGGLLILVAIVCYLLGAGVFAYGTWRSRRMVR